MIDYIKTSKSVYVLFILLAVNHLGNIFGCKIQQLLTQNIFVKHLFGLIAMYTFVVFADYKELTLKQRIYATFGYYIWFILIARTDYRFTIVILIIFLIMSEINQYEPNVKAEKILFVINILLTIVGVMIYYKRQRKDHAKNWDISKFLLGIPKCESL